jgi:hypothetical protein
LGLWFSNNCVWFEKPWQSKIDQKMMKEEARAVEHNKREGARADQVVHAAEVLSLTTTKPEVP